jgi:hypothetical protein
MHKALSNVVYIVNQLYATTVLHIKLGGAVRMGDRNKEYCKYLFTSRAHLKSNPRCFPSPALCLSPFRSLGCLFCSSLPLPPPFYLFSFPSLLSLHTYVFPTLCLPLCLCSCCSPSLSSFVYPPQSPLSLTLCLSLLLCLCKSVSFRNGDRLRLLRTILIGAT